MDHPDTLTSYNALGYLYFCQGLLTRAAPLCSSCLTKRQEILGKSHPDTLISYNILARIYQSQGQYGEAEPLFAACFEQRAIKVPNREDWDTGKL